jgi:outer membrane lipoprotein-sorting protein
MAKSSGSWLAILLLAVLPASAQSNSMGARDPHAVALLTQVLTVAGGQTAVSGIQDFTATGTVTYTWGASVQGTVTVRGRGLHEFRIDATLPDGLHSWVVNDNASFLKNPDGSISTLPPQNTAKIASATFPLVQLLWAIQDTSVSISDGRLITHDGAQAHEIVVQKIFSTGTDPLGARSKITKADIFIDPNTLTVQSIEDGAYPMNGAPGEIPHEMRFSAYQAVSGVLVPFSVTELIAGQQTMALQLKQVTFNNGLMDSDFE